MPSAVAALLPFAPLASIIHIEVITDDQAPDF